MRLSRTKRGMTSRMKRSNLERLKYGDSIALISPAGKIDERRIEESAKHIRSLGFFVQTYPYKKTKDSFFSSTDDVRAKELCWAMTDPSIKAVFCCRGGYGSARALMKIDSRELRQWKQKLVLGYSDITYLHQWIYNHFQWGGVHGPLIGFLEKPQIKSLLRELMSWPNGNVENFSEASLLRSGKASGRLFGGNLSLFQVLGPAQLPKEKMVLLIEEVGEDFYRIDRMIQNLRDAGYSKYIQAVLVGKLYRCGKNDSKTFGLLRLKQSFKDLTDGPVLWGARFGHGLKVQRLFKLGVRVEISGKKLTYIE